MGLRNDQLNTMITPEIQRQAQIQSAPVEFREDVRQQVYQPEQGAEVLSDEDIDSMESGEVQQPQQAAPVQSPDVLSDDDIEMLESSGQVNETKTPEQQSPEDRAIFEQMMFGPKFGLESLEFTGRALESVGAAPTRAAIGAIQKGEGFGGAAEAFVDQFGSLNIENAPTGEELAKGFGVSSEKSTIIPGLFPGDKPLLELSPAQVTGLGIDITADPLFLIPIAGEVAKAKGLKIGSLVPERVKQAKVAAEASVETVKSSLRNLVKPQRARDFPKYQKIAKKFNIQDADLSNSVVFGRRAPVTVAERVKAQGPFGGNLLEKHDAGLKKIHDAFDDLQTKIGKGSIGLNPEEAGDRIREASSASVKTFFDNIDSSFRIAVKDNPGMQLTKEAVANVEKSLGSAQFQAKKMIRSLDPNKIKQGRQLMAAIDRARQKKTSLKQFTEVMQDIGEIAFETKTPLGQTPPAIQEFKKLYFKLQDSVIETLRKNVGNEFADNLILNNQLMSQFLGEKGVLSDVLQNSRLSGEKVFQRIIESGDGKKIRALKAILSQSEEGKTLIPHLKSTFIQTLKKGGKDDFAFSFSRMKNALQDRKNQNILMNLFDPEEAKDLVDLALLGERYGPAIENFSATDISSIFRQIPEAVVDKVISDTLLEDLKRGALSGSKAKKALSRPPSKLRKTTSSAVDFVKKPRTRAAAKATQLFSIERAKKEKSQELENRSKK